MNQDSNQVRTIIKKWLVDRGYRAGRLADTAGINRSILSRFLNVQKGGQQRLDTQSALEIYRIMAPTMNLISQRKFLQAAGLSIMFEVGHSLLPFDLQGVQADPPSPDELGQQWMAFGSDLERISWEKALPVFRKAETLFGQNHPNAARAGSRIVTMLLSLGDYKNAHAEITRVQQSYATVIEPEVNANLVVSRGWICYYEGNFAEAAGLLLQALDLARLADAIRVVGGACHFLGRVYTDWGESRREEALFRQADKYLFEGQRIRAEYEAEADQAFDFLRRAQFHRVHGGWREALECRQKARQLFNRDRGGQLHIMLEEARTSLANNEVRVPQLLAESALEEWAEIRYAKGIADSVRILAEVALSNGKFDQAVELCMAALCAYPVKNNWDNRKALNQILATYAGIREESSYLKLLRGIEERARGRKGHFMFLNQVYTDPDENISQVVQRMAALNRSTRNKL
jgi:tetratricopeptide (TPR) repeat protein